MALWKRWLLFFPLLVVLMALTGVVTFTAIVMAQVSGMSPSVALLVGAAIGSVAFIVAVYLSFRLPFHGYKEQRKAEEPEWERRRRETESEAAAQEDAARAARRQASIAQSQKTAL